jgi:hypothetical protein
MFGQLSAHFRRIVERWRAVCAKVSSRRCISALATIRSGRNVIHIEESRMKNPARLTGAIAVALGGLCMGAAPIANADIADDAYLHALTQNGITWANGSDSTMISVGHAVCQDWSGGNTLDQTVTDVRKALGLSDGGTGTVIGAATAAYCPQYQSKLPT